MASNKGEDNAAFTIGPEDQDEADQDQNEATESQNEAQDNEPLVEPKKEEENPDDDEYIGDIFREIPPEEDLWSFEQCLNSCRGFMKIVFALILFCMMFICIIVSKGSTLFITSRLNKAVDFKKYSINEEGSLTCGTPHCPAEDSIEPEREVEMIRWMWGLFFCQTAPYALMFLRSSWKMCFKVKDWPTVKILFIVMATESIHVIGTFMLFFCLMPQLDVYRGLFMLTGVAIVPGFLLMFNSPSVNTLKQEASENQAEDVDIKDTGGSSTKDSCYKFLYILAFLGQISIALIWFIFVSIEMGREDIPIKHLDDYCNITLSYGFHTFLHYDSNFADFSTFADEVSYSTSGNTNASTHLPTSPGPHVDLQAVLPENIEYFWPLIIAPLLISFGYWENFVDKHSKLGGCGQHLQEFREKFNKCKTKTYLLISLWKIFLTLMLMLGFYRFQVDSFDDFGRLFKSDYFLDGEWFTVAIINFSCGMLSFYTADIIIKGRLQIPCYTLPLFISTPVLFGLLTWACQSCDASWDIEALNVYWNCYGGYGSFSKLMTERFVYIGFLVWLSEVWITRYLWFPKIEKLAKIDKIFIYPMFCGLTLEQSLMFIRRRNDFEFFDRELQEHQKKEKKKKSYEKEEPLGGETDTQSVKSDESQPDLIAGHNHLFTYEKEGLPPFIYICATMWHENVEEMRMMLVSLLRLDEDQMARRMAQDNLKIKDPDYYMFEVNIFFDDAFTPYEKPEEGFVLNSYVTDFIKAMDETVAEYHDGLIQTPPEKSETPYGGKLVWTFPSGVNKLVVHLKDKMRIRNRKRWSQVMYLHFFLGQGILAQPRTKKEQQYVADNTYILALDGDIDFQPEAVILLLDLMKRNVKVAAACGRIHPTGNGYMVWYQKFEYSLSHWLQKATEHVLGCVLCSPGCFSMFRGSSLMDDNVTASYSKRAEKAIEHVQYDQGEDRWLCTLLLQQGYRVEYSAAADAYTHAPVGFNEFFGQRRRWITSTFANLMDLLKNARYTAKKNENISMIYMMYQGFLFASSILGPATIFMLVVGAFEAAFMIDPVISFCLGLVPLVIFMVICFQAKNNIQLGIAALLSSIYAVLQMLVIVGIARQMVEDGVCSPSAIFFMFIGGTFILAALIHPQEFSTLFHGFLYFLLIPCMYLILIIYSLCNLHVISWGTRENKPVKTAAQIEAEKQKEQQQEALAVAKTADGWRGLLMSTATGPNEDGQSSYSCSLGACCKAMCCVAPGMSPENKKLNRIQRQMTVLQGQVMKIYENVATEEYECNSDESPKMKKKAAQKKENNGKYVSNSGCENSESPFDTFDEGSSEDEPLLSQTLVKKERKGSDGCPTPDYDTDDELVTKQLSPVKQKLRRKRRGQASNASPQKSTMAKDFPEEPPKPPPQTWINEEILKKSKVSVLDPIEERFWSQIITKYLYPLTSEHVNKEVLGKKLKSLRNKAVFAFFIIDLFLMVLILGLNLTIAQTPELAISWNCTVNGEVKTSQLDPIGFCFIIVFGIILLVQIFGMLIHRLFTFLQIISATVICKSKHNPKNMDEAKYSPEAAIALARQLQRINKMDAVSQEDGHSDETSGYNSKQNSDDETGPGHNVVDRLHRQTRLETHTTMNRTFARNFLALKEEAKLIRQKQEMAKPTGFGGTIKQTLRYRKNNNKHTAKYGQYLEQMVRDNELDGEAERKQDAALRQRHGLTMRDVNNQRKKVRGLLPNEFKMETSSLDEVYSDEEANYHNYQTEMESLPSTAANSRENNMDKVGAKATNNTTAAIAANTTKASTSPPQEAKRVTSTSRQTSEKSYSSSRRPSEVPTINVEVPSRSSSSATLYSSTMTKSPSGQTQLSLLSEEPKTKDMYKFSNTSSVGRSTFPNGVPGSSRRSSTISKKDAATISSRLSTQSGKQRIDSITEGIDMNLFDTSQNKSGGTTGSTTTKSPL